MDVEVCVCKSACWEVEGVFAARDVEGICSAASAEWVSVLRLVGVAASEGLLVRFLFFPFPFPLTCLIGEDVCGPGERDLWRILLEGDIRKSSPRSLISPPIFLF